MDNTKKKNNSANKTVVVIMIISIACKLFGFIREMVMASFYGTSLVSDAFVMATTAPGILFGGISSLTVGYIPIYKTIIKNDGDEKAKDFTRKCLTYVVVLCIIAITIVEIFPKQVSTIVAPGYTGEQLNVLVQFLRISIFHLLFANIATVYTSYLNAESEFVLAAIPTLLLSSVQIVAIYISSFTSINVLVLGHNLSVLLECILLGVFAFNKGFHYKPRYSFDLNTKQLFKMMIPVFISDMAAQINSYIDKMFSSRLGHGYLSGLTYSHLLITLVNTVIATCIVTVWFTPLSEWVANNKREQVTKSMRKITVILLALYIPISVGFIFLSDEIVSLIFERGSFDIFSVQMTAKPLMMYSIGLIATALSTVWNRVLYANKDTSTAFIASVVTFSVNFLLNPLLINKMGSTGLALASSLSAISCLPIYLVKVRKLGYKSWSKTVGIDIIKICIASGVMALCIFAAKLFGFTQIKIWGTIITILISMLVYFVSVYLLKVEYLKDIQSILEQYKKKFFNR